MPNDAATSHAIVAVTGEDDRYRPVRSRATALAAGGRGTVILYDLDAAGVFSSPVPTEWSGEGEKELTEEASGPRDRLDPDELDTAGRGGVANQVRQLRSMGGDAGAWLPRRKDAPVLAESAERRGASLVLFPPDLKHRGLVARIVGTSGTEEANRRSPVTFET